MSETDCLGADKKCSVVISVGLVVWGEEKGLENRSEQMVDGEKREIARSH